MPKFHAQQDKLFCELVDGYGQKKTKGGIFVTELNRTSEAIRPRWFKVCYVGKQLENNFTVGEFILVEHGRWSRQFDDPTNPSIKLQQIDPEGVIVASADITDIDFV